MAFRSLAQLKTQVWDTREQVVRELKANALAEQGPTHRIIEYNGKWQVEDVDPDANQEANDVSDAVQETNQVNNGKKKSAMARIKQAAPAPKKKAAAKKEAAPAKKQAATPAPAAAEPDPVNDMTPLPNAGGPYHLRLEWAQFNIAEGALTVSKAAGTIVQIIGADGKQARLIDGRIGRGSRRPPRQRDEGSGRKPGETDPNSKRGQCTKLLMREKGAKAKELEDVVGRKVSQRFLDRLATRSKAILRKLGEGHWRLIPA
jgi:hypothetical protein